MCLGMTFYSFDANALKIFIDIEVHLMPLVTQVETTGIRVYLLRFDAVSFNSIEWKSSTMVSQPSVNLLYLIFTFHLIKDDVNSQEHLLNNILRQIMGFKAM